MRMLGGLFNTPHRLEYSNESSFQPLLRIHLTCLACTTEKCHMQRHLPALALREKSQLHRYGSRDHGIPSIAHHELLCFLDSRLDYPNITQCNTATQLQVMHLSDIGYEEDGIQLADAPIQQGQYPKQDRPLRNVGA